MKAKLRRGAIIFLSVLLTAAMLCGMTVSAADTADRGVRLYRGTFYYTGNKDTFYYGDSYFDFAGDADNEHLRTFSAALAFSVLGTSGEDTIELMTNIGMEPDSIVMEDMVSGTPRYHRYGDREKTAEGSTVGCRCDPRQRLCRRMGEQCHGGD